MSFKSNSFVAAEKQVCLQPVLEHQQRPCTPPVSLTQQDMSVTSAYLVNLPLCWKHWIRYLEFQRLLARRLTVEDCRRVPLGVGSVLDRGRPDRRTLTRHDAVRIHACKRSYAQSPSLAVAHLERAEPAPTPQACSGAGTRWNTVPANTLEPEGRSGK